MSALMTLLGVWAAAISAVSARITETSDTRVTETGDRRVVE